MPDLTQTQSAQRTNPLRIRHTLFLAGVIAVFGWLDQLAGPQVNFSLFYIFFIVIGAWRYGKTEAWASAVFAVVAWAVGEEPWRPDYPMAAFLWNVFSRCIIFGFIAAAVSEMKTVKDTLARANRALAQLAEENERLARQDPLTKLANTRLFEEALETEAARHRRSGNPLCLAYIDLDNFKKVNDHYGHTAGDEVLKDVANILKNSVRQVDTVARLGGDEFAIILADSSLDSVRLIGERVVKKIEALNEAWPNVALGASVGIVTISEIPDDPSGLMSLADEAMYIAKTSGKGQISVRNI